MGLITTDRIVSNIRGRRPKKPRENDPIAINYHPHKNQFPIHVDNHRYRVICAGRRFGKSVLARQEILRKALAWIPGKMVEHLGVKRVPRFWIVSPTYKQGRGIHWEELKAEIPSKLVLKKDETRTEIRLINGTIIELKGSEQEESLRGTGLVGVVLDECAYMKQQVWPRIIEPMLLETKGWAVFISTPNGPNYFKDLFQKGVKNSKTYNKEWKSWHFTSYDNPFVDPKEIDKKKRDLPEEEFRQEYMADFVTFKNLVYKDFDFKTHVIKPFDLEDLPMGTTFYRAIDFGFRHATVCLWIAVTSEEKWYVIDEYYATETSTKHSAGAIKSILPKVTVDATFGDPQATQLIDDYENLGLYITAADRSHKTTYSKWVNLGISKVAEKIKKKPDASGKMVPDLFIFNNCEHLIKEFQVYRWKVQPDERKADAGRVLKRDDDCLDALRYFAVSYSDPLGEPEEYGDFPDDELFKKGFYQ